MFNQLNSAMGLDCNDSESSNKKLQQIKNWRPKYHPLHNLRANGAIYP